jgi:hypothetical protein
MRGGEMDELTSDLPLWADVDAYQVLKRLCEQHKVPVDAFRELVAIERLHQHRERARGIYEEFDDVFRRMD